MEEDRGVEALDAAVAHSGRWNGRPPLGVGLAWNLVLLRGTSRPEERERVVRWQVAGVQKGMIDFYLRWWNGNHCINNGFGKLWGKVEERIHLLRKNLHNISQNLPRGAVLGKSQLVLVVFQVNSVTQRATQFVVRRVHQNGINIKRETTRKK